MAPEGLKHYRRCHDTYGQAISQIWLAICHQRAGANGHGYGLRHSGDDAGQRYGYAGLLTTPTLFGPRDRMTLVPLLLAARADARYSALAQELLAYGFPAIAADDVTQTYHPGVTLRIQAFGRLRVWRGSETIAAGSGSARRRRSCLAFCSRTVITGCYATRSASRSGPTRIRPLSKPSSRSRSTPSTPRSSRRARRAPRRSIFAGRAARIASAHPMASGLMSRSSRRMLRVAGRASPPGDSAAARCHRRAESSPQRFGSTTRIT